MSEKTSLESNVLHYRIKLMALWFIIGVSFSSIALLNLMEPGIINKYLSGEVWADYDPGTGLAFMSFLYFIPLVMTFLTLVLNGPINRIVNKVMSLCFLLILLGSSIAHLTEHVKSSELIVYSYNLVLICFQLLASGLLVFYSFKLQKIS